MTDGPSLSLQVSCDGGVYHEYIPPSEPPTIDLTNFALWIELQPVATLAGLLDLIGNECYRRELFSAGHDLKQIVVELLA